MSCEKPPANLSIEDLLREEQWLAGFVRRLVGPDDAEDVVQDTWVAALQGPPRSRAAARTWLGRVAHNFARQKLRRRGVQRRVEAAVARPEVVPSTAATVARLATVGVLVKAVMALREPYQSAVLLRHYHGLEIREVARRTGSTEATVRQRLKRGLDQVRAALRRQYGSKWRGACQVLILGGARQLTTASEVSPFALGVLLMSKQLLLASIVGLGMVSLALSLLLTGRVSDPVSDADPDAQAVVSPVVAASGSTTGSVAARRLEVEPAAAPVEAARAVLPCAGRVLDVRGAPVPGVRLLSRETAEVVAESDDRGRLEFSTAGLSGPPVIEERYLAVRDQPPRRSEDGLELLYVVAPRVHFSGFVVDSKGRAMTDVRIVVEPIPLLDFPEPLDTLQDHRFDDGEVDELGRFEMRDLPGGVGRVRFERVGYQSCYFDVPTRSVQGHQIVLQALAGDVAVLVGRVLADGIGVAHARVGLGDLTVHSDAYGAYRLEFDPASTEKSSTLYASKVGFQTLLIRDFTVPEAAERIEQDLRLPGPAKSISGVVLGPDGQPLSGAAVMLWEEEPIVGSVFAEELAVDESVKPLPYFGKPRASGLSDANGAFTIPGLRDREYRLRVFHWDHLALTSDPIAAGATGVELRYPEGRSRSITGRVTYLDGEAAANIKVRLNVCLHRSSLATSWQWGNSLAITDGAGRFELDGVPGGEDIVVTCNGDGIITPMVPLGRDDTTGIEIVVQRRCHFRIEGAQGSGVIELLDAYGHTVDISTFAPNGGNTSYSRFDLAEGKTPVLSASEAATTLVVITDGGECTIPVRLVPGRVTVIRP